MQNVEERCSGGASYKFPVHKSKAEFFCYGKDAHPTLQLLLLLGEKAKSSYSRMGSKHATQISGTQQWLLRALSLEEVAGGCLITPGILLS